MHRDHRFAAINHYLAVAVVMAVFGLGTVPAMAVFAAGVRRLAQRDLRVWRVLALLVLASGLFSVAMRMGWIPMPGMGSGHSMEGHVSGSTAEHAPAPEG